jgi:hypothetical protein
VHHTEHTNRVIGNESAVALLTTAAHNCGIELPSFEDTANPRCATCGADTNEDSLPPAKKLTPAQILKQFFNPTQKNPYRPPVVRPDIYDTAAKDLGSDKLVTLISRTKIRDRKGNIVMAASRGWISLDMDTLTAVTKGCPRRLHILQALNSARVSLDPTVTASDLTRWIQAFKGAGVVHAIFLWNMAICPAGVIDDDIVTTLGYAESYAGSTSKRISKAAEEALLAAHGPKVTDFIAAYTISPTPTHLVRLFDKSQTYEGYDSEETFTTRRLMADRITARMIKTEQYTPAVIKRLVNTVAMRSDQINKGFIGYQLLNHVNLGADDLVTVVDGRYFVDWINGAFELNQPTKAMVQKVARQVSLDEIPHDITLRATHSGADLPNNPEAYLWIADQLVSLPRLPAALHSLLLTHGDVPHAQKWIEMLVQVANRSFANAANTQVHDRLWQSLVTSESVFRTRDTSFDGIVALYNDRSAQAASRVGDRQTQNV